MSCNGCRVLRKGCSENCVLRQCMQFIDNPNAQAHATLFVAKFFGRADLMSFISNVPENQRSALFQSLLYESVGRTINPVNGAVGLLWTGNWHVCQSAVETVLRGGTLQPLQNFLGECLTVPESDYASEAGENHFRSKSKRRDFEEMTNCHRSNLDLCLMSGLQKKQRRAATPSEESETTTIGSGGGSSVDCSLRGGEIKLLPLFV